jgi:lysyl-tRNA synthetase class 1
LVAACNSDDPKVLWGYIRGMLPNASEQNNPALAQLVEKSMNYYHDFVKANKRYRAPSEDEKAPLQALLQALQQLEAAKATYDADHIQNLTYKIGQDYGLDLRNWFQALYQILLGADQGPRFGSFVMLYGLNDTIQLLKEKAGI